MLPSTSRNDLHVRLHIFLLKEYCLDNLPLTPTFQATETIEMIKLKNDVAVRQDLAMGWYRALLVDSSEGELALLELWVDEHLESINSESIIERSWKVWQKYESVHW